MGIIFVGFGFVVTWKSIWFYETFGSVGFADKLFATFGSGSLTFYRLLGVLFIFIGFSLIFNLWGQIAGFILSPVIEPMKPLSP